MESIEELLLEILAARMSPAGAAWLDRALEDFRAPESTSRLLGHYAAASRSLGKRALALDAAEKARLAAVRPELPFDHWGADEAGRALLVLAVSPEVEGGSERFLLDCFEQGDSREQQSWLRALSLVPGCERFVWTATDACRSNILPLFESIACENPYPSRCFPELHFNQMVLKSLFNGVAIARIVGLEARCNDELSRMADDYVSEREAAGRDVPADIWLVVVPRIPSDRLTRVYGYLRHEDPRHRYWAALALGARRDSISRGELERQRRVESEASVAAILNASLDRMDRCR